MDPMQDTGLPLSGWSDAYLTRLDHSPITVRNKFCYNNGWKGGRYTVNWVWLGQEIMRMRGDNGRAVVWRGEKYDGVK